MVHFLLVLEAISKRLFISSYCIDVFVHVGQATEAASIQAHGEMLTFSLVVNCEESLWFLYCISFTLQDFNYLHWYQDSG